MFKIAQQRIAKNVPVHINEPADGGRTTTVVIRMDFEILSRSDFESLTTGDDEQLLLTVIKGWQEGDVGDPNGNVAVFNEENLRGLINVPYVRTAIVDAYVRTAFGTQARRKNF